MERYAVIVRGMVQGVGFRPFVYGVACRLQLNGFVKNCRGSVLIEVEGTRAALRQFLQELRAHPPPLSRIEEVSWQALSVVGEKGFRIEPSEGGSSSQIFISPDVATCSDCLAELFDPSDRRYRYPFLNCTNCGPRLTIVQGAPYDRERTTMGRFIMCAACRSEYEDPHDRRFHAQPTACAECGPQLTVMDRSGKAVAGSDPLALFADSLRAGKIGALKGLGGYHLVCDAGNERAVGELRGRKHRDEKPFAVMVRDVQTAERLCNVGPAERDLLQSPRRPIVLLRKGAAGGGAASDVGLLARQPVRVSLSVAPGNPYLGVMLPYTPLHYLLMEAVGGIPLVMTSGNRSDEPIAYDDREAVERLGDIADLFLMHDRAIHVRCDDSVTRIVDGAELPVRRSRGYAPASNLLPVECPCPILAVGGQLKGVFALGHDRQAFLSHHLCDLDHFAAYRAFERDVRLYEQLFDVRPKWIVHDLHPDYASTGYAGRRAEEEGLERLPIQHHHAHMASCMAEHGLDEPVIGVSFDGAGFGTDETIWGGEFLVGDYTRFSRAAHLRYVRMPGGDQAVRQPWRMGASHLRDAGCDHDALRRLASGRLASEEGSTPDTQSNRGSLRHRVSRVELRTIDQMLQRGFNSPWTSSAGRLFDAVASIAGVAARVSYEGQAAMQLEWLATEVAEDGTYPFELSAEIGTRPLIRAVARDVRQHTSARRIARRFHSTLVEIIAAVCGRIRSETQLDAVVLSGGVFMNALLTREACARLASDGFRVYRHRLVPANDGGLSLGQLAIAAKTLGAPVDAPRKTDFSVDPEGLQNKIALDSQDNPPYNSHEPN